VVFRTSCEGGSINAILYFVPQPGQANGIGSNALMVRSFSTVS